MPAITFEQILKFNPNHDNLGRFSSSNGGGGAAAAGASTGQYSKEEQIKAIEDWSDGAYGYIRSTQRGSYSGADADKYKKQGEAIEEYIKQQPDVGGELFRGISTDQPINFKRGQEITMNGTSSWSKDETIAQDFAGGEYANGDHAYIFTGFGLKNSADISSLAMNPGEKEVVVSKDTKFRIMDVINDPNEYATYVVVESI